MLPAVKTGDNSCLHRVKTLSLLLRVMNSIHEVQEMTWKLLRPARVAVLK